MQWERVSASAEGFSPSSVVQTPGDGFASQLASPTSPLDEMEPMQIERARIGGRRDPLAQEEEDAIESVFDPRQSEVSNSDSNRFRISTRRFGGRCGCANRILRHVPKLQCQQLLKLAAPNALASILTFALNSVNLAFVGRLKPADLAGAALGNSFMNVTGYAVMYGFCSAIDTLCSQHNGAGQKQMVGLIAQRAAVAYLLILVPIIFVWLNTEQIYLWTGQDPLLANLAGQYVRHASTTIVPTLYVAICSRFLQAQAITRPQVVIALLANILHAVLCWLFIFHLEYGLIGAPYAYAVTYWSILAMYLIYIRYLNQRVWTTSCPSLDVRGLFRGWKPLFTLGFPGMLMLVGEWGSFELVAIACGWIGAVELDTLVVVMNLEAMFFMFPLALAISASTLIGNSLGANKPQEAKLFARASLYIGCVFIVVEILLVGSVKQSLAKIFTNDPTVISYFHSIAYFLLLFLPCDCIQGVQGGVIRGTGYQSFGAKTNFLAYWALGLPLGYILAFKLDVGLPGLLVGLVLAVTTMAVVYTYRINRFDWVEESASALRRVEAGRATHLPTQTRSTARIAEEEFDDGGDIELQQQTQPEDEDEEEIDPAEALAAGTTSPPGLASTSHALDLQLPADGSTVTDDADFDLDNTEDGLDVEARLKQELGIDAATSGHPADEETTAPLVPAPTAIGPLAARAQQYAPPPLPPTTRQHYEYVVHSPTQD